MIDVARYRSAALGAALVAGCVCALVGCGGSKKAATPAPAGGVSVAQLRAAAAAVTHPIYWVGPNAGVTYELSQTKDGRTYVRYLPAGVRVGDPRPDFLTVGTYPQKNAFATLEATAKAQGVRTFEVGGGGLAFQDKKRPTSIYIAFRAAAYQIEVYDPSSAKARNLVVSGRLTAVMRASSSSAARALSADTVRALGTQLHQPVYWAGPESGSTYEYTHTSDGRVYIRYLPAGVRVGDPRANYLTIGTYPQRQALTVLKRSAAKTKARKFTLSDGGVAFIDPAKPTSAYLAFPGGKYEIEIYDPDSARVRRIVQSGEIVATS